jgi:hypothetical protein
MRSFLLVAASLLVASVCVASPPAVIDVWIDAEALRREAALFGDAERERFARELARISGPDRSLMFPPPAPLVGVRHDAELSDALVGLICPSLERGEVAKIDGFLAAVTTQALVRGRGNREGWTVVSYHLLRTSGQPWRLEARHRNVAGPERSARLLREQTAPTFVTYLPCVTAGR